MMMQGNRKPRLCISCLVEQRLAIKRRHVMGRGILLWFLGVPIPVIILLALIWH
jgi:hypothetical protein